MVLKTLKRYGIKPQHRFGQNFLCDDGVLRREVAYADVGKLDTVLEIGPGIGNLTERLLARAGRVVVIEQDRQFAPCLEDLQKKYAHLEIIWGDALDVDFPAFDKAVANLPYKVSLPLIFKMLEQRFSKGVLIFQKRLATRICAKVGEKGYCRLSVALGRRANVEILETLGRDVFHPRPDVESAVVKIERIRPRFDIPPEDFFKTILEHLFKHRQYSVAQAGQKSGCKELSARSLSGLNGKLRGKTVCQVTPREFGEITRFCWAARRK
jgi:16S rRNA (adenine1518-N6/adenine1519-N6)-dimethyltransferase